MVESHVIINMKKSKKFLISILIFLLFLPIFKFLFLQTTLAGEKFEPIKPPEHSITGEAPCGCSWWDLGCLIGCLVSSIFQFLVYLALPFVLLISTLLSGLISIFAGVTENLVTVLIGISFTVTSDLLKGGAVLAVWKVVRDVALWFFAVFLAFIGLATIFKIESYWAKRALVPLLVAALLFNFLPFITRTIINIGNSLTCSFLSLIQTQIQSQTATTGGEGTNITCAGKEMKLDIIPDKVYKSFWNDVVKNMWASTGNLFLSIGKAIFTGEWGNLFESACLLIGASIFSVVFWCAIVFALILLALIFLARMAFLCVLFIVSPIALATFAFNTKEVKAAFPGPLNWEGWLKEILEWSFVGVPLAFFLGIASVLMINSALQFSLSTENIQALTGSAENIDLLTNTIKALLPLVVGVIAIYIGLMATPTVMGQLAKGAVAGLIGVGTLVAAGGALAASRVGKFAAGKIWGSTLGKTETGKRFAETMGRISQRLETYATPMMGEMLKGIPGGERISGALAGIKKAEEEALKAAETRYEKMSNEELKSEALSRITSPALQKAAVRELAKRGKIDEKIAEKFFAGKTLEQIQKEYGTEVAKSLKTKRPDLLAYVVKDPKTGLGYTPDDIKAEIEKLTPKEVTKISSDAFKNKAVVEAITSRIENIRALERESVATRRALLDAIRHFHTTLPREVIDRFLTHPAWQV